VKKNEPISKGCQVLRGAIDSVRIPRSTSRSIIEELVCSSATSHIDTYEGIVETPLVKMVRPLSNTNINASESMII
jgi:hypothetical protein